MWKRRIDISSNPLGGVDYNNDIFSMLCFKSHTIYGCLMKKSWIYHKYKQF